MADLKPYTSPFEILEEYGAWFSVLCMRAMRCHSNRIVNDAGGYSPKSVSVSELIQIVSSQASDNSQQWLDEREIPPFEKCNEILAMIMSNIRARIEVTFEEHNGENLDAILPAEALKQAFSLKDSELLVLICLALVQYDDRFARAWRYVSGAADNARMTVGSLMMLLDFIPQDELRGAFLPDSALRRHALIQFGILENWGHETPLSYAPVFMPNRLVSYLLAEPCYVDIPGCHELDGGQTDANKPSPVEKELARMMQKKSVHAALIGYAGLGRTSAYVRAARKLKQSVYELDLPRLCEINYADDALREMLAVVMREIRLKHAVLVIRMGQPDEDGKKYLERHAHVIEYVLNSQRNLTYAVTLDRQTALSRSLFGELTEVEFPAPSREDQPLFWTRALSRYISQDRAESVAEEMAVGYCLSESEIRGVVEQTLTRRSNLAPKQALTTEILSETLNKTRGHRLEGLATLRSTSLYLKDIVLSDSIRKVLDEVIAYARYRDTVMQDWGFAKYNLSGAGLSVLLSGVPGTGKTMTALVLAHELRRALYVVDLSRVVDKYIGETEKRLAQIFDEAERSQAMLLFDEADSLFAKRTDVKSSNDRYANLEVNYLLQRLEAYSGVTILTTNFGGGLDEALARRIQFKIDFPMPDASQRAELWQRLVPPAAPLDDDVDFSALAEYFEMSGGHIKNAVFRASIQAATQQSTITHNLLWDAALHEYREMGHVVRDDFNSDEDDHRWN